jgi:putative sterol carrier protein
MRVTRKTGTEEIRLALEGASTLKEVEAIARQCNPSQLFDVVLPWCSANRPEIAELLDGEKATAHLEISGDETDGGWWTFHINGNTVRTESGQHGHADLGVHMDILTWEDLQSGENDPPRAYTQGRIKFSGNPAIGVRVLGRLRKYL